MKRFNILIISIYICYLFVGVIVGAQTTQAQTSLQSTLQGIVKDTTGNQRLAGVSVRLKKDSVVVMETSTNELGAFKLQPTGIRGAYHLEFNLLGYQPYVYTFNAHVRGQTQLNLDKIQLKEKSIELNEVAVAAEIPIQAKGDTTIYNAGSFGAHKNDDLERLLKLLPGFEIDASGKIKAKGKDVSRLTVEGEQFFGGDPAKATKTLRADMVKSVELIEERTDESKESGVDDGERQSRVNIVLKEDKKRLWFGDLAASGGTQDRYEGMINAMRFNGANQFALNFSRNNINNNQGAMSGMVSGMMMSSGVREVVMTSGTSTTIISSGGLMNLGMGFGGGNNGISTNTNLALNLSRKLGRKDWFSINGSYAYNGYDNTMAQLSNAQQPLNNELLFTQSQRDQETHSGGHMATANSEMKIDSLTSINVRSSFNIRTNENSNKQLFATRNELQEDVNSGNQQMEGESRSPSANINVNVNRSLNDKKGSVSLSTGYNFNANKNRTLNQSLTRFLSSGQSVDSTINQDGINDTEGSGYNMNLTVNRKLSKKHQLFLNLKQNYSNNRSLNDQITFEYNPITGLYDLLVANMTSEFDNRNWNYTAGTGLNYTYKKLRTTLNADFQNLGISGNIFNQNQDHSVRRNNWVFMPNLSVNYTTKSNINFGLNLTKSASQPSVSNLQPVFNNSNPLYIREGNPDLKLSEGYRASLNLSKYNFQTMKYWNVSLSYNYLVNSHSNFSTVDPESRIQTSRPVDVAGNQHMNLYSSYNMPFKGNWKKLQLSLGASGNLNKSTNFVNSQTNLVRNYGGGGNADLSYNHAKIVFRWTNSLNYNQSFNTIQDRANQSYFTLNNGLSVDYRPVTRWRLELSGTRNGNLGNTNFQNISYNMLNASIHFNALKSENLIMTLSGFDLLNQNSAINRNVGMNGGISETQSNTISRYFYLKLAYRLQAAGGSNMPVMRFMGL
jgi:hypothetical protein